MIAIWTEAKPAYDGEFVTFEETEIYPKPIQKPFPPIWIGGGGPKSVEIAAEFAQGWLPPWIPPDQYPARIDELRIAAAEHGRANVDWEIGTEVYVSIAPSSEEARNQAVHTLSVLSEGFADDATPAAIEAAGLIGSGDQIREKLEKYVAAGVTHYEMKFIYQSIAHLEEQLGLFREQVIPAFR
jgi:alkanesulfonate monooxygenase SsuD/methylene tetrahydromethanopterin reductase-like flavin-dependent oxidoreductase (luciferase family)